MSQFRSHLFPITWVKFPLVRDVNHLSLEDASQFSSVLKYFTVYISYRLMKHLRFLKGAKNHLNTAQNYIYKQAISNLRRWPGAKFACNQSIFYRVGFVRLSPRAHTHLFALASCRRGRLRWQNSNAPPSPQLYHGAVQLLLFHTSRYHGTGFFLCHFWSEGIFNFPYLFLHTVAIVTENLLRQPQRVSDTLLFSGRSPSKGSAPTATWRKYQTAQSLQPHGEDLIAVAKAEIQVISAVSAALLHISDDCSTQSGRLWITKANVPSLKIFCPCVWRFPLTFPIQNQAVGQKGNDYMFSGVSTRFTDWTQSPGNRNAVIYSWQGWSREFTWDGAQLSKSAPASQPQACPPSTTCLSSDAKLTCPQLSRCLGSLWPWHAERKGSGGRCRTGPFSFSKEQLWRRD